MSTIAICSLCGEPYPATEPTEGGVCIPCLLAACDQGMEMEEADETIC